MAEPVLTTSGESLSNSDDSKIKQLLNVLKKAMGVKDLGMIRLSLPANLITPIGNLEYWCYLDRPDLFSAIDHSEDPFERMLALLRWTLTKDCKFVHGPVCKPYNSVLGEQFRCIFDVKPTQVDPKTHELIVLNRSEEGNPTTINSTIGNTSVSFDEQAPTQRSPSLQTKTSSMTHGSDEDQLPHDVLLPETNQSSSTLATSISKHTPNLSNSNHPSSLSSSARVGFLNEQVSHHPPISCFWYESRNMPSSSNSTLDSGFDNSRAQARVIGYGIDQISAKFTGTSLKVYPGPHNKGIFINLPNRNEKFQITHPTATVTGLLRASPYVVISEYSYINSLGPWKTRNRFRTMIHYLEESWIGKPKFALEGIIYETQETDVEGQWTKIKHVPVDRIWCQFQGSWRGKVTFTILKGKQLGSSGSSEGTLSKEEKGNEKVLIDLSELEPIEKRVRDLERQEKQESRKLWEELTKLIKMNEFGEAGKVKQRIEQDQRDIALERKTKGERYRWQLFEDSSGDGNGNDDEQEIDWNREIRLSEKGRSVLEEQFDGIGY